MMQQAQIQVLDTIDGKSILATRAAFEKVGHDQNAKMYSVRLFEEKDGTIVIAFALNNDGVPVVFVRNGMVLSPPQVKLIMTHSKQTDALHAGHLPVILAALPIFEQRKMNLADYRITLFQKNDSYVVTFTDKDSQSGGRGNPGKRLGFEVEFGVADLRVLNSHFIR